MRTVDPRACIWQEAEGEHFAVLSHEPPFWLALPARDARFAEVVQAAQSQAIVDIAVDSQTPLPASLPTGSPPGSIMVDIGADIGLLALQLAALTWYAQLPHAALAHELTPLVPPR